MKKILFIFLWMISISLNAQTSSNTLYKKEKKVSLSSGIGGNLLQIAQYKTSPTIFTMKTIPRYTYFFNMGVDINFHITKQIAPFTGFQMKNIGIIKQITPSLKIKERVYTFGAPVGFKFYSKDKNIFISLGADVALAFNYKNKIFTNGKLTKKNNEWFSDKASLFQSSAFAGVSVYGISLFFNYYLNNFYPSSSSDEARLYTISLNVELDKLGLKINPPQSKK